MKTFAAVPRASMLIESMRDVGYDLEMALADIMDNSITAGARRIDILADTSPGQAAIAVLDDGKGMSESELHTAMRLGSRDPLDHRTLDDLGRFGLGMKTASFSQCRRMTVVTRQGGVTSAARWDLDRVRESDEWLVEIPSDTHDIRWSHRMGENGTLVLWEQLDRLAEGDHLSQEHMTRRLNDARAHLELVFHRFLQREGSHRPIIIAMNDSPLKGIDPLQFGKSAERPSEPIMLPEGRVVVQAVTLPHHTRVGKAEWERIGGPRGHARTQGFYLYRERRLIIWGTWFDLTRQLETTKLTRVRIDIPNTMDASWKIDVRKASAQPPPLVRRRLRALIDTICEPSKRVYTQRGQQLVSREIEPFWVRVQDKGAIRYQPNDDHPVQEALLRTLSADQRKHFENYMELLGAMVPVDAIYSDFSTTPTELKSDVTDDALEQAIRDTLVPLRTMGVPHAEIVTALQRREPFRSDWKRTSQVIERLMQEGEVA